jgi:L-alanine-DL-glutamate epimerase-like enolase superfamily enzyme
VNGREGFGEATVLTGYTEETIEGSWDLAQTLVGELSGLDLHAAQIRLEQHVAAAPFTVTAFATAIEMAQGDPSLTSAMPRAIRLLKILNATEGGGIERELEAAVAEGYETIKVKVGFDVDADLDRLRLVQRTAAGRLTLTVDANQGYSREDGCRFAANIDPDHVLFFEQACHMHDWEAAVAVSRVSSVPVMLDESIYDLRDLRRAAELGCARYVKVKLMNFASLSALREGSPRSNSSA